MSRLTMPHPEVPRHHPSGDERHDARLRKIAILIASVDSEAASQLMRQLPADTAARVEAYLSKLNSISELEKKRTLEEFRIQIRQNPIQKQGSRRVGPTSEWSVEHSWESLSVNAIVRAVRGERAPIIAVVVSQLPPHKGVGVLTELCRETGHAVLRCLSQLTHLDPEIKREIDEHLAVLLGKHQHQVESEAESQLRLDALMQQAPAEVRADWERMLQQPKTSSRNVIFGDAQRGSPSATGIDSRTTAAVERDFRVQSRKDIAHQQVANNLHDSLEPSPAVDSSEMPPQPALLPDVSTQASSNLSTEYSEVDPQRMRFDLLLDLPRQQLAELIGSADPEIVLLALAGASPGFMRRFRQAIAAEDFAALEQRIRQLGPIQIRDIDEAQLRLMKQAGISTQPE